MRRHPEIFCNLRRAQSVIDKHLECANRLRIGLRFGRKFFECLTQDRAAAFRFVRGRNALFIIKVNHRALAALDLCNSTSALLIDHAVTRDRHEPRSKPPTRTVVLSLAILFHKTHDRLLRDLIRGLVLQTAVASEP